MAAMSPALLVAACASADAAPDLPPDLTDAVRAYDRATVAGDVAALAGLVADDYMLVNSDATVQNKQEYLADFSLPGFQVDAYDMEEIVSKVWGEFALTGGLLPLSWTQDGARHSRSLRIVHAWVREDARWRIHYTQLTRIQT